MLKLKNQYFILRHGHSLRNVKGIASCWPEETRLPLTKKGVKEIQEVAEKIKKKKIDLIFYSDLLRTKQTAEIVGKRLRIKPKTDKRLREIDVGILNGKPLNTIHKLLHKGKKLSVLEYYKQRFQIAPPKGETYSDIEKRLASFIKEIERKYKNKNILLVSHQRPLTLFEKIIYGYDLKEFVKVIVEKREINTGELRKINQ